MFNILNKGVAVEINLDVFNTIPEHIYDEMNTCPQCFDINDSARLVTDLPHNQTPNKPQISPTSGTHPVSSCYSGNFRTSKSHNPSLSNAISTETYPSLHAYGIHSTSSLTKTSSIETPLGVVRLNSSPSFEPVRMHSGTSSESFRRDISLYKLNAMPALEEDDHISSSGADEICGRSKTNDKSKIKNSRRKRFNQELVETADEERHETEENPDEEATKRKGKFRGLSKCFKGLFPCTRANKNELDPDCLLDVMSDPQEKY
ncbi:uncharacterized protein LOC132713989 isoform X2 [Ruditapes philippinarum]|uniref:uncharacterized protein LOC132713989 isoform X2 n=1 Tax=Ruditapes philippinarum TaxID=129788 RepID=UPI00295B6E06|nr:uncharacterized protein LOC132713989 isoform X2 [Ruditapes philippinarum]